MYEIFEKSKTDCARCSHCPVCELKKEYIKLVEDVPSPNNPNFEISVRCKFYIQSSATRNGDVLTWGSITTTTPATLSTENTNTNESIRAY